jgi:hypothetical protein
LERQRYRGKRDLVHDRIKDVSETAKVQGGGDTAWEANAITEPPRPEPAPSTEVVAADPAAASVSAEPAAALPDAAAATATAKAATEPPPRRPRYRDQPSRRPLRIYSFDPMLANTLERVGPGVVTVEIPWEPVWPGPRGARVIVTDYDGSRMVDGVSAPAYYEPVNLDMTRVAIQGGLPPSETDPRFHQQMVYEVAMRTIEAFDKALGRRVRPVGGQLRLYPHAFRGENAYYDPEIRSVLFGYFQADRSNPGKNIPGQFIFTALSGDIIAHEVTHALIHRIRPGLLYRTNRDVAAFHEAISDITAIFLHFTLPGVVEETIAATRSDLSDSAPLNDLASQFGYATGRGRALRSALDTPDPSAYEREMEPHARGAILVAAVFDAFITNYQRRTADLVRLATGGSGVLGAGSLHPDLVSRVSREAIRAADQVLTVCLRAFDYLPPVDVTFSDFLRALVTADRALYPTDAGGLRTGFIDAFRRRGIYPQGVMSLGESALVWPSPNEDEAFALEEDIRADILAIDALKLNPWQTMADAVAGSGDAEPLKVNITVRLKRFLSDPKRAMAIGLSPGDDVRVRDFGATFRYDEDGAPHVNFIVQCVQQPGAAVAPEIEAEMLETVIRRSVTVIFDESGWVEHIVTKPLPADDLAEGVRAAAKARYAELVDWIDEVQGRDLGAPFGMNTGGQNALRVNFALLHAGAD